MITQALCRDAFRELEQHVKPSIPYGAEQLANRHTAGILGRWLHGRDGEPQFVPESSESCMCLTASVQPSQAVFELLMRS